MNFRGCGRVKVKRGTRAYTEMDLKHWDMYILTKVLIMGIKIECFVQGVLDFVIESNNAIFKFLFVCFFLIFLVFSRNPGNFFTKSDSSQSEVSKFTIYIFFLLC